MLTQEQKLPLTKSHPLHQDDIKNIVPDARVYTDPLRTLAYGTDASFYRLVPKIVVKVPSPSWIRPVTYPSLNSLPGMVQFNSADPNGQNSLLGGGLVIPVRQGTMVSSSVAI